MSENDDYILDSIRTWVWSGFHSPDEVNVMLEDLLEEDVDEPMLRAAIASQFTKKAEEEKRWPAETDCDRLDAVFRTLNDSRVVALQNTGYTLSDGFEDVGEVLSRFERGAKRGYCFYHGQDLERVVSGGRLMLAFSDLRGDAVAKAEVGNLVVQTLHDAGFTIDWDGNTERRLELDIDWKRRYKGGK